MSWNDVQSPLEYLGGPLSHPRDGAPGVNTRKQPVGSVFEDFQFTRQLELTAAESSTLDQLLVNLGHLVGKQSSCLGLWVKQSDNEGKLGEGKLGPAHQLTDHDTSLPWELVESHVTKMVTHAASSRNTCAATISLVKSTEVIVAPVNLKLEETTDNSSLVLVGCFSTENQSSQVARWLLSLVSQTIARWYQHRIGLQNEAKIQSFSGTFKLVNALDQTTGITAAAVVVANHMKRICQAQQFAICLTENSAKPSLKAISDVEQVDHESESNKTVSHACQQAAVTKKQIVFSSARPGHEASSLALEKYCRANHFQACVNLPLITDDGRLVGAILLAATQEQIDSENYLQSIQQVASICTGHLDVVMRANRGFGDLLKAEFFKLRASTTARNLLICTVAVLALMCVPLPYRVACDCEIQPVKRRFVAAPYQGILENAFVESGEIVEANQPVARLDGRQIRIELSGVRAEYDGAKKRRDSALAQGDVAQSQIARSEMRRHQSSIDLLEQKLTNLNVQSPIAGIVVAGDLEKAQGMPLEMGQTMFEIAPLDEMVAEIGIPESEIQHVTAGMSVVLKLNAYPFKTWAGTISKIQPHAEVIEDDAVFVAEVILRNDSNQLRPGMKGTAKITSNSAPLGWNLFHGAWESVRYWTIW